VLFSLKSRLSAFLRARGQALGLVACAALFVHVGSERPSERTPEALATLLANATGTHVSPKDVAWEPRGSALGEMLWGRPLLFLGSPEGAPRDLFRAWVRVTPGGQPISVARNVNLTKTKHADEALVLGLGSRAAFVSIGRDRVLSVTALDGLGGAAAPGRPSGIRPRLRALAAEGSATPLARTDLLVTARVPRAELELKGDRLTVDLGEPHGTSVYAFDRRAFAGDPRAMRAVRREVQEPSVALTVVDRARDLFGVRAVEIAGRAVLAAKNAVTAGFGLVSFASGPKKNEPVVHPFLGQPPLPAGSARPDPLVYRRVVHPEGAARSARLVLVTLDMRQLEIGYVAGSEHPHATADVPGEGRLPVERLDPSRVIAVFNGGAEHHDDEGGAMAGGRPLIVPDPELPSAVFTSGHELLLGRWPFSDAVPDNVTSFVQRRSALVGGKEHDRANETGTRRRSALCATEAGHVVYAYAERVDRATFRRSLAQNGCIYALPLAGSPERLGFALARLTSRTAGAFAPIDDAMDFDAEATVHGSTRDFFYVARRSTVPGAPAGVTFRPDDGVQPPPAFLPGIFAGTTAIGGLSVRLVSIERGHADYRLRAGPREIGARGEAWAGAFAPEDAARALMAIELGHATAKNRFGLVLGTSVPLPIKPVYATLVIGDAGAARILLPGEAVTLAAGEQAVQLPLLADDRDITARARARGENRERGALCVADGGRLLVASAAHDSSDPLAVVLRSAGCRRVVELDRGSHHPAFIHRAGTDHPPRTDYESSTLWALARPMRPAVVVHP
jgi:hypothetical protein